MNRKEALKLVEDTHTFATNSKDFAKSIVRAIYEYRESRTYENCTYKNDHIECLDCSQYYHNKYNPKQ